MPTEFITDSDLYTRAIVPISKATKFVWIGTADIKDMHVKDGSNAKPLLAVLDQLVRKGVQVRLVHAKEPGPHFRESFDKYPSLWEQMERVLCPRVHFKHIVIDGTYAYTGSANLTGAGLGIKSDRKRNFEAGIVTTDPAFIQAIMEQYDTLWMGTHCKDCGRKEYCSDPINAM